MISVPYLIMFVGGFFSCLFDIHAKNAFPVLKRHAGACFIFSLFMGLVADVFFWILSVLKVFNPTWNEVTSALVMFVGYRLFVQSSLFEVRVGQQTKTIGLNWIYDELMLYFLDYIKSKEDDHVSQTILDLGTHDLRQLALLNAKDETERARIEAVASMENEDFKRRWFAKFCVENQEKVVVVQRSISAERVKSE